MTTKLLLSHSLASQSFDIIDIMDNELSPKIDAPKNTPTSSKSEYETKRNQINELCQTIKKSTKCSKQKKRELNALHRHYIKLCIAEKSNISFFDFHANIIESYKNNFTVNHVLKELYC
jgi:hypothetical protein